MPTDETLKSVPKTDLIHNKDFKSLSADKGVIVWYGISNVECYEEIRNILCNADYITHNFNKYFFKLYCEREDIIKGNIIKSTVLFDCSSPESLYKCEKNSTDTIEEEQINRRHNPNHNWSNRHSLYAG